MLTKKQKIKGKKKENKVKCKKYDLPFLILKMEKLEKYKINLD